MNLVYKISVVLGFACALAGYSFWPKLWENAFYDLVAAAFMFYTFAIHINAPKSWKDVTGPIFIICINSLVDELTNRGTVFNWTEYVTAFLIVLYYAVKSLLNEPENDF